MAKKTVEVVDFAEPIKASIAQLNEEITELSKHLVGLDDIVAQLNQKRKQVTGLNQTLARLSGTPATTHRPRGQNLSDIQDHLVKNGGATVREIAEATGLNVPSVRYTLGRNHQFSRDAQNIWTVDC